LEYALLYNRSLRVTSAITPDVYGYKANKANSVQLMIGPFTPAACPVSAPPPSRRQ